MGEALGPYGSCQEGPAADEPAGRVEDLGLDGEGTWTLEVLGEGPAADKPAGRLEDLGLVGGSTRWGRHLDPKALSGGTCG